MEKLKEIIRKNNMSTRPEFYSGRGATLADLNEKILFGIHKDLQAEFGKRAANGFVKMVDGIKVMSATAFLNGLYDLCANNWKYNQKQPLSVAVGKDGNGNYNMASGMVGMMVTMFSTFGNDTNAIKCRFLACNGIKHEYCDIYGRTNS